MIKSSLPPVAEGVPHGRKVSEFQMPLLPDPGKNDEAYSGALDFSMRLGSTLAREQSSLLLKAYDTKQRQRRRDSHSNLQLPSRKLSIVSPRSLKDADVTPIGGAKVGRGRNSRRSSNNRLSTISNTFITVKETARAKLSRVLRTVRIISGVCIALKMYVKRCETKTWSFMEMYLHVKADLNQCVAFNPQSFARVEPERHRLRKLLAINVPDRTREDVKVILALLRDNTSFQDYPFHVQFQLSHCMTYQSYEARRVVLKQGHRPEAFYILLAGSVIANIQDTSPETGKQFVKTVKEMGPGDTFGDFDSIIREPLVKQIDEHIGFCKSMALFKDFPCDKLADNPSQFFYHFFKKGDIVVKDSRQSKYIIVVKAGKCQVVCTYAETQGSKIRTSTQVSDLEQAFPHYEDMRKIRELHRKPKSEAERTKESLCLGLLTGQIDPGRLADHGPDVQRPKSCFAPSDLEKIKPPPLKKSKTLGNFFEDVSKKRRDSLQTKDDLIEDFKGNFWSKRLQFRMKKPGTGGRPVTSARSVSSRRQSSNPFYAPEKHVYAQIATLGTGTVFGLESLVQRPSCHTSLVSEGAECIFISKRIFLSLANIKVLRIVTDMIQTYPSQEYIQEQVKSYRTWQKYKRGLVQGVLDRMR
ncbi:uncharacterized protein LOC127877948 isoform X2 [Dreissena polymorpha]|uniref:uncharacterized protein LOC127877948 isoform X2 n=1 Tax=Dreissena polymorpha TaxID=45954 RepID=UPI0022644116|nr:uncharacterized protein LOC127877948 isoform X2 [Dreissena polymorpha]